MVSVLHRIHSFRAVVPHNSIWYIRKRSRHCDYQIGFKREEVLFDFVSIPRTGAKQQITDFRIQRESLWGLDFIARGRRNPSVVIDGDSSPRAYSPSPSLVDELFAPNETLPDERTSRLWSCGKNTTLRKIFSPQYPSSQGIWICCQTPDLLGKKCLIELSKASKAHPTISFRAAHVFPFGPVHFLLVTRRAPPEFCA